MTFALIIIGFLCCLLYGTLLAAAHLNDDRNRWRTLAEWWQAVAEDAYSEPGA